MPTLASNEVHAEQNGRLVHTTQANDTKKKPRRWRLELSSILPLCVSACSSSQSFRLARLLAALPPRRSSDAISSATLRLLIGKYSAGIPKKMAQPIRAMLANSSPDPSDNIIFTRSFLKAAGRGQGLVSPAFARPRRTVVAAFAFHLFSSPGSRCAFSK